MCSALAQGSTGDSRTVDLSSMSVPLMVPADHTPCTEMKVMTPRAIRLYKSVQRSRAIKHTPHRHVVPSFQTLSASCTACTPSTVYGRSGTALAWRNICLAAPNHFSCWANHLDARQSAHSAAPRQDKGQTCSAKYTAFEQVGHIGEPPSMTNIDWWYITKANPALGEVDKEQLLSCSTHETSWETLMGGES